jgi:hypothetical protein
MKLSQEILLKRSANKTFLQEQVVTSLYVPSAALAFEALAEEDSRAKGYYHSKCAKSPLTGAVHLVAIFARKLTK